MNKSPSAVEREGRCGKFQTLNVSVVFEPVALRKQQCFRGTGHPGAPAAVAGTSLNPPCAAGLEAKALASL